jgi:hypothetical protein
MPVRAFLHRSAEKKGICLRILDLFKFMLNIAAPKGNAQMAELVDARDSNSRFERSAGSIPVLGTEKNLITFKLSGFYFFIPIMNFTKCEPPWYQPLKTI